jgi:hypothetical protein
MADRGRHAVTTGKIDNYVFPKNPQKPKRRPKISQNNRVGEAERAGSMKKSLKKREDPSG